MRDKITKEPAIRFKGFTDPWEQRKLGDVAEICGGGTPSTSISEYWDGHINWFSPVELGEQIYVTDSQKKITELGLQKSSAKILPIGTVLFTSRAGIGKTAILAKKGTTNQGFQSILPNDNELDTYFIFSRTDELKQYGEIKGAGSTFVEVSGKQMAKMPIMLPSFVEQRQMGLFFKQFDQTITLQQRKLDLMKIGKQTMLSKMFPKVGEHFPEIRFKGFTDAWEQRKLVSLFKKGGSGGTPKSTNSEYYGGDIPFLAISDISNSNGYINKTEKSITQKGLNNSASWIVPSGAISLAMYASVGKLAILNIDVSTSQAFYNMVFDDQKIRDFVYQRLAMANEIGEWTKLISTGTQANLNADKVKNFEIQLPTDSGELGKVGLFLKQLDQAITLQQRKLDQMKTMKQSLLKAMFV